MSIWTVRRTVLVSVVALAFAGGCASSGDDLDPGGSAISGQVIQSLDGNASVSGITVSSGNASSTTDAGGNFTLANAPTGEIEVRFQRGACVASFLLDTVTSRSSFGLSNVVFGCSGITLGFVGESFDAILNEDAFSRIDNLDACVRVGDDERNRDVDARTADVFDDDGDPGSFDDLRDNDRVEVDGTRDGSGRAATFEATRVAVDETNVENPCEGIF